jgi:hypothetical protein
MLSVIEPVVFWVHASPHTKQARLHRHDCIFCNSGTGMIRRPIFGDASLVWSSYPSMADARRFMSLLPFPDKSDCKTCLPKDCAPAPLR